MAAVAAYALTHGFAGPSFAQPKEREALVLQYATGPGCPAREAFVARLQERSPSLRIGSGASPVIGVAVASTPRPIGTLTFRSPDGSRDRTFTGASCDEVIDAISLSIAIATDAAEPDEPPPTVTAQERAPTLVALAPGPEREERAPSPAQPGRTERISFVGSFGTSALGASAVAPSGSLALDFESGPRALRLGVYVARGSTTARTSAATASFGWNVVRAEGCPFRVSGARLSLRTCARLDAGVLDAAGHDVLAARTERRPWFDAGAVARVRFSPGTRLFVEGDAGAMLPLVRDHFELTSGARLYDVPFLVAEADFSIGWTIW